MKNWKQRILVAAIPLAAVTVGCLAAQDDMDAVIGNELRDGEFSGYEPRRIHVNLIDTENTKANLNSPLEEAAIAAREALEMAREGGSHLDDLILVSLFEDPIGVGFGVDAEGSMDACTIDVAAGAEFLGEAAVHLQLTSGSEFGGFSIVKRVESEEACEGEAGFFFEETEEGPYGQISMCASSCDTMLSAQEAGAQMMVDVVVDEG